ncbi:hypothetical protein HYPSUDRAFT_208199 [Hypholoma sublateritium FD-334 SS-4]|uniref:Uncharacterized protein n=1 Tax=Hypholoma sublateritium (strain FD-334 SS-4) TaxID=945553 RepID=A0A0D2N964_HYPSF|nr:hypothetical protein HYPSUDRAFT_209753 [Hypholoma sublateritium FD-334 SS-4]KJA15077.1 hypothetical protein HYPSUDRAFT_208199 [Hypholoma sublateritium FD-334 SS-4]
MRQVDTHAPRALTCPRRLSAFSLGSQCAPPVMEEPPPVTYAALCTHPPSSYAAVQLWWVLPPQPSPSLSDTPEERARSRPPKGFLGVDSSSHGDSAPLYGRTDDALALGT